MASNGNIQSQIQTQSQTQQQTLSPQQLLEAKLLQLSVVELEEQVRNELGDNPALEDMPQDYTQEQDSESDDGQENDRSPQDHDDFGIWEDADDTDGGQYNGTASGSYLPEIPVADTLSFYDLLAEQLAEQELDPRQKQIALYLIGSIDNNGFLDKDLQAISDDLAFYHGLDTTIDEIDSVLRIIQDFDPAGIGARDLQECLLLQIRRKPGTPDTELQELVITEMFDDFTHKRWDRIGQRLGLDDNQVQDIISELVRLNPRPGSAMGESVGHNRQVVVPDFLLDNYDGEIHFQLNSSNIPVLRVSQEYSDMLERQSKGTNSSQRDAAIYLKRKLDSARNFIEALKQRHQTMTRTMQAIIDMQMPFFTEGDETLLKPMILKDIAGRTGYDISTISRVCSGKYVQTPYGTFPLKWFFTDGVMNSDGEEVSVKQIHSLLRELTENEDPEAPLSDGQLAEKLQEKGFTLARRTIAKYRDQLGIPVARLRKK
ncbi:MAG: RNA polymerase factor sigma-54 [Bacteroidaceae bacterium]|nr:RNA polymerase factor sigma-54 [Bacteroidaceae bacterium]